MRHRRLLLTLASLWLLGCYDIRQAVRDASTDLGATPSSDVSMDAIVDRPMDVFTEAPLDAADVFTEAPLDAPDVLASMDAPTLPDAAPCVDACTHTPPRPISPLSSAYVTARRPTLRWTLDGDLDGSRVELCRDRGCLRAVSAVNVTGASWRAAETLARGVYFWRVTGLRAGRAVTPPSPTWSFMVDAAGDATDSSYGSMLDVNGDGLADLVVGAPTYGTNGPVAPGEAQVFHGSASGVSATPSATLAAPTGVVGFGTGAASAGDVNGDGFTDALISYWRNGPMTTDHAEGGVYLHLGGARGLSATAAAHLPSALGVEGAMGIGAPASMGTAGDVNSDGYGDIVVGASGPGSTPGRAYVYLGAPSGVRDTHPAYELAAGGNGNFFGTAVLSADLNADGRTDLAIGAIDYVTAGRVYLYFGTPAGLPSTPSRTLDGARSSVASVLDRFGWVLAAGDTNGDGYLDLAVSATYANNGVSGRSQGRVDIFHGGAAGTGLSTGTPDRTVSNPSGTSRFGMGLALGDLDHDGYADLLVGAPDVAQRLAVFRGGPSGLSTTPALSIASPLDDAYYGQWAWVMGDTDGDGLNDLVVGSAGAARAYVVSGWSGAAPSSARVIQTLSGAAGSFFGVALR